MVGAALVPLVALLVRGFRVEIEDEEAVLVTRFGKLVATLNRPGWHWLPRVLPWIGVKRVSLRRDYREIEGICVNDARGTSVMVDVFLEFRVADPARATFEVQGWEQALTNLVAHSVISILGNREFQEILCDRTDLAERVQRDIAHETERWGIRVEALYLRDVRVLPEVGQQMFETVAARLERAKADIEEDGRQRAALLEAETASRIAELVAAARAQYPAAMGRAFAKLKQSPKVFSAYNELYELSLLRPSSLVAFKGFAPGEIRPVDAAMFTPPVAIGGPAAHPIHVDGAHATNLGRDVRLNETD
jgi:regulator of protease activity HflC (stomatin/prohibitin superfamily)